MYSVDCCPKGLVIGKQGENEAEKVAVDFSPWASEFGAGTISARLRRPKDSAAYPVVLTTEGTTATWTVSATDTQHAGAGSLQLVYIVGDMVAKSVIWPVRVLPSLEEGEAPEPYESWLDTLEGLAADTQENARDAAASAADASASAEDAAQSAQSAAESAASITGLTAVAQTLPEGSEASASFDSATDTLTLGIPKGDTGATGPAGPAGPKGDTGADGFSPSASVTKQDGNIVITITDKDGTTSETLEVDDVLDDTSENPVQNAAIVEAMRSMLPVDTASGSIASFPDGADDVPMLSLKAQIEPVQDLHGYDSPWPAGGGKNKYSDVWADYSRPADYYVCPISMEQGEWKLSGTLIGTAITGCVVGLVKSGTRYSEFVGQRNVLSTNGTLDNQNITVDSTFTDPHLIIYCTSETQFNSLFSNYHFQLEKSDSVTDYAPFENICPISGRTECVTEVCGKNLFDKTTAVDGYIDDANGQLSSSAPYKSTDYIRVVGGNSYYIVSEQTSAMWGAWYDENKTYIGALTSYANVVKTAPSNASFARLTIKSSVTGNVDTFAINYPSTDTSYHAYDGQTYTTDLGRTVYGGTLDVVSGELVVDRAMVDLGSLNWNKTTQSGVVVFYCTLDDGIQNEAQSVCSIYPTVTQQSDFLSSDKVGRFYGSSAYNFSRFAIHDSAYDNADETAFKTAMSGVQLCYELATPIEYTLTPQEVKTYLGQNNIWNDVGDTEVTYRADIAKYIEKKVTS